LKSRGAPEWEARKSKTSAIPVGIGKKGGDTPQTRGAKFSQATIGKKGVGRGSQSQKSAERRPCSEKKRLAKKKKKKRKRGKKGRRQRDGATQAEKGGLFSSGSPHEGRAERSPKKKDAAAPKFLHEEKKKKGKGEREER